MFMTTNIDPPYPKYQAYLASIPGIFGNDGLRGQRAVALVRHGVLVRRMIHLQIAFKSPHTPIEVDQFMVESFTSIMQSLIEYSALQRRENDILNAVEKAWAILHEEETEYGAQRMMLDSFNPTTQPN